VLDTVRVADLELLVLESLGGHVPAQVFLFAPDAGALFCGDYLIDLPSLSEREKSTLSLARFLMTSTNSDSRVFGREMTMLQELMRQSRARLEPVGVTARVFPGHGDFYAVADAEWRCA
jgi:glyoxylase-like metal-dependent hydrolase (beta-lactamase superfamily II)